MSNTEVINISNGKAQPKPIFDKKANKIIQKYTLVATGSGFIPFSIISAATVTGIQVMLIKDLCHLYDVPFAKKRINVIINSALGSAATRLIAIAAVAIPGVSTPLKGLSGAAVAGLYTATVGEFYKIHFQKGGTLEDASIGDLTKYFVEEYKRGDLNLSSLTNPVNTIKRAIR